LPAAVELTEVVPHAGRLDTPVPGPRENYAVAISGHVDGDARAVAAYGDEPEPLAETSPGGDGTFALAVDTLTLPTQFEIELRASSAPLATISGHRAPLPPAAPGALQPIVVTGLGRMGGNWLVRLLGEHPDVVAYRPFEVEPRILAYWTSVLLSVNAPASQVQQLATHGTRRPLWWAGNGGTPAALEFVGDGIAAEMGRHAVEDLCRVLHGRVEAFYRTAAAGAPRFFAEKGPAVLADRRLARELYPGAREIVMLRDLRDLFTSTLAFTSGSAPTSFSRGTDDAEDFLERTRERAVELAHFCRARAGIARIVRYEELIREPASTLSALLEWIGLDASAAGEMLAAAGQDTPQMRAHRTSRSVADSIGRWERDLPAPLRDRVHEAFADLLAEFGY
jgi:hypothetical protein